MIEAINLSLAYPDGTVALKDANFKIERGALVYIIGPSGSGKTSLLKLLLGEIYPTTGSLEILGQRISEKEVRKIRALRRKIGPIFQDFRLMKGRTVIDNVMQGIRFMEIPSKELKKQASEALERVGLTHKTSSLVEHLSWGEKQRVSIARALVRKPALILADEPTGNLDKENALKILELLISLQKQNTTVIITTHATHLIDSEKEATLIQVDRGQIAVERLGLA